MIIKIIIVIILVIIFALQSHNGQEAFIPRQIFPLPLCRVSKQSSHGSVMPDLHMAAHTENIRSTSSQRVALQVRCELADRLLPVHDAHVRQSTTRGFKLQSGEPFSLFFRALKL